MFKQLPPGIWIQIHNLPTDTTDVTVQEYLARYAVVLPLENISVAVYPTGCFAKICITNDMAAELLNARLKDHKFQGRSVYAVLSRKEKDFSLKKGQHRETYLHR